VLKLKQSILSVVNSLTPADFFCWEYFDNSQRLSTPEEADATFCSRYITTLI